MSFRPKNPLMVDTFGMQKIVSMEDQLNASEKFSPYLDLLRKALVSAKKTRELAKPKRRPAWAKKKAPSRMAECFFNGVPNRIRTGVVGVKGRCPGPG
jgi:hypothetical protein